MVEPLKLVSPDVAIDPNDPFGNLDALRNPQDYAEFLSSEETSTFPLRKLQEGLHLRVNPDPEYTLLKQFIVERSGGTYFVWPGLEKLLGPLPLCCNLHVAVDGHGAYFMLRIRQPNPTQDEIPWLQTARMVSVNAMKGWVRVTKPIGKNGKPDRWGWVEISEVFEPKWPVRSMTELLNKTFPDLVINKPDHDVIKNYEQFGT
jgi:hypothetical protein